jgi:hypothetical protein
VGNQNAREKSPSKTQPSGCLLQALTNSCLLRTAGRRKHRRVVDRSISADRSLRRRASLQAHASESNTTRK